MPIMRKITLIIIILCLFFGLLNITAAKSKLNEQPNIIIKIEGMTCRLCSKAIEKSLLQVNGITEVQISHKTGTAEIIADVSVTDEEISNAVKEAGTYSVADIQRGNTN
jgi:copper chaperone CopZ